MNVKKLLFSTLALTICLINFSFSLENKIILKIDSDIVTSLDIKKEARYLSALNPKIMELDDVKIFEISKNSLIREKVKKIEILRSTDNARLNDEFLKKIIEARYKSLNLETRNEFINYLKNFDIEIDTIEKKIEIEALWNQLIFLKFSNNVKINKENLRKKIETNKNLDKTRQLFLKEIIFDVKDGLNLDKKYLEIKKSISNTGFENTASLYSISDTAKIGGVLGWINENSLSEKINKAISKLKLNEYSQPITLPGGFLILQISDIKIIKEKFDIDKELEKAINIETNRQLNQFSNIYFNKAKQEISINEI